MTKLFLIVGVILLVVGVSAYFVPASIFQSFSGQEEATPTLALTPDLQPSLETVKQLKNKCLQEVKDSSSEQFGDKPVTDDLIWQINNKYRLCLAGEGLTPEDLLSYPSGGGSEGTYVSGNTEVDTSFMDKFNEEQKQKCQEDMNKYNICMGEKNAEMAEYNTCLSETSNPDHWKYGLSSTCFKPYKSCYKPVCAY